LPGGCFLRATSPEFLSNNQRRCGYTSVTELNSKIGLVVILLQR